MKLKELLGKDHFNLSWKQLNTQISGITCDSRKIKPGYIFFAISGNKLNGKDFIPEAIGNGARAVVLEHDSQANAFKKNIVFINATNVRKLFSICAARFFGNPTEKINLVAVTGTNGKTTITYLIEEILRRAGISCAVLGTINYRYADKLVIAKNTTPDAATMQSMFSDILKREIKYAVMEVSSHSLDQDRVIGVNFKSAIFTNLTQDHLDYHITMKEYFKAKSKLFTNMDKDCVSIINNDDRYGRRLLELIKSIKISYGVSAKSDIMAYGIEENNNGLKLFIKYKKDKLLLESPLIGLFNVYNILAACAFALREKIDRDIICKAIRKFKGAPGRLELVSEKNHPFEVFVDFAHTESALKNTLIALNNKKGKGHRLITVFGCGGDRDKTKRPKMGFVASSLSSQVILTSDNPRSEDPLAIISDIRKGIRKDNFRIIADRKNAIREAISIAEIGDIVLIAGKGHETYQIFKDKTIEFDDRDVAREFLRTIKTRNV